MHTHTQAQEKNNHGDYEGAKTCGRAALGCNICGLVVYVATIVLVVAGFAIGAGTVLKTPLDILNTFPTHPIDTINFPTPPDHIDTINFPTAPTDPINFPTHSIDPINFPTLPIDPINFPTLPIDPINFPTPPPNCCYYDWVGKLCTIYCNEISNFN